MAKPGRLAKAQAPAAAPWVALAEASVDAVPLEHILGQRPKAAQGAQARPSGGKLAAPLGANRLGVGASKPSAQPAGGVDAEMAARILGRRLPSQGASGRNKRPAPAPVGKASPSEASASASSASSITKSTSFEGGAQEEGSKFGALLARGALDRRCIEAAAAKRRSTAGPRNPTAASEPSSLAEENSTARPRRRLRKRRKQRAGEEDAKDNNSNNSQQTASKSPLAARPTAKADTPQTAGVAGAEAARKRASDTRPEQHGGVAKRPRRSRTADGKNRRSEKEATLQSSAGPADDADAHDNARGKLPTKTETHLAGGQKKRRIGGASLFASSQPLNAQERVDTPATSVTPPAASAPSALSFITRQGRRIKVSWKQAVQGKQLGQKKNHAGTPQQPHQAGASLEETDSAGRIENPTPEKRLPDTQPSSGEGGKDVGSGFFLRRRTKTRSRQKNIRKDRRPTHMKPCHLVAGIGSHS
eukprot:GHVT01072008.1.p1 GENE.GHVT01072008.1~~GHVT01072008.1.p1  ORF type:complete len:475 (-),score=121.62 GHVT01072008.1:423-1847(-)